MTFKEIFHINDFSQKIKLDNSETDFIYFQEKEKIVDEAIKEEKFFANEWNQEYELIYSSYVLE
jgi:hypothetical protein